MPKISLKYHEILWEPNPVGILEMPQLWKKLRKVVRKHKPDQLTKIYVGIDKEIVYLRLGGSARALR